MPTALADPPVTAQAPPAPSARPAQSEPSPDAAHCEHCGTPLASGQDWCLQCGAGAPGSLAAATHSWRSTGIVIASVALLVAGAAAAAYAAWGKSSHAPRARSSLSALAPASTPLAGGAGTGAPPSTSTVPGRALGPGALARPPKIPLTAVTPKATQLPPSATAPANTGTAGTGTAGTGTAGTGTAGTGTAGTGTAGTGTTTPSQTTTTPASKGGSSTSEQLPAAIELDTNAASTYDPYSYPASNFGDPSLAIDGDTTTAWSAQVEPSVAPKMAEGVAIDLRSARRVADVKLYTTTLGMTVQVYGANGQALPGSITDAPWVPLSHALVIKKKSTTIKLRDATRSFRFFVLWISRAPQSAIGTPQAPGHVSVDEFELFPPGK